VHHKRSEHWRITVVDTGEQSMTGGRLKRVRDYLGSETFCFTYGDGVSDVNLTELIAFHKNTGRQATLTGVLPPGRYGMLDIDGTAVRSFKEKPEGDGGWINGGFFVLEPSVIDHIEDDMTIWERGPLEALAASDSLGVFKHTGFWHPMDTLRDKTYLEALWTSGKAPWKTWD
jgi:glucose-1-phosphate cytidylyltransferase